MLRALQEGKITRVGGEKEIKVDVRVLAATNKNLMEEVEAKRFRMDLYHRLSVILIQVPSLNARRDDIPALIEHFMKDICEEYKQPQKVIEKAAIESLKAHNWTGNIRELRNVIERLIILSDKQITKKDFETYILLR
jgi:DNA-binding NtrC family response regulator